MSVLSFRGLDNPPPIPERVLIADRLYDGAANSTSADQAVVIIDGLIAWVGPTSALPTEHVALPKTHHPGATVLPGLIETHAHLGSLAKHTAPDVPDPDQHEVSWAALSSVTLARQLASVGVTTVQSLGSAFYTDVALREAVRQQHLDGPRIVAAGPPVTTTGGHGWSSGGEVDSKEDIRHQVRLHHRAGTDLIKVMATGGFMTPGTAPWNAQFTTDELQVLIEEAHRLGKHTAAHAHGTQGIRRAVEAGIDYIAHASFVNTDGITEFDHELADQIAEKGVYVDTCSPPSYPPVPDETRTPRAAQLYAHGVILVAGHDIGAVLPPSGYTYGLQQLAQAGLPHAEVLRAATSNAAAAVGLAGVTGVIREGYVADLIVVDGDPLADLTALDRLIEVIIGGKTFQRDPVPAFDPGPGGMSQDPRDAYLARRERVGAHPGAGSHTQK